MEQQKTNRRYSVDKRNRTRGGGRYKIPGGDLQQGVVWSGSPIKWSMPLPLMATVKTQQSERRDGEKHKNDGSLTAGQLEDN